MKYPGEQPVRTSTFALRTSSFDVRPWPFGLRVSAALLFLLFLLAGRAAERNVLLDSWFAAQTNLHTWSADVVETRHIQTLAQPLVSTGKVWVVVPDRFRWELGQPAQTIAVRQPDQLLLIYPRLKRVEQYPLNDSQPGPWREALALLEASFPRSRAHLESRFRLLSVTQTNSLVELALQPKSEAARKFITELRIGFNVTDFLPVSTELRFSYGASMRNEFSNPVINASLPEDLFQPRLGPDFTVVKPLGP